MKKCPAIDVIATPFAPASAIVFVRRVKISAALPCHSREIAEKGRRIGINNGQLMWLASCRQKLRSGAGNRNILPQARSLQ